MTHSKNNKNCNLRHQIVGLLYFFLFFFTLSTVNANPNWNNFGNQGIDYSGNFFDGTIFSSNYPAGNTNFTHITNTDGNDFTPLVFDINNDAQNEIITFFSSSIRLYNNKGEYQDTFIANGTLCGNGNIVNFNSDQYNQIVFMSSDVGGYWFYILGSYGNTFTLIKSYFYTTSMTSTCDVFGGVDYPTRDIWSVNTNASILSWNMDTDAINTYKFPVVTQTVPQCPKSTPYFKGGICSIKYNNEPSLYYRNYIGTAVMNISKFNTVTKTFTTVKTNNSITNHVCGIAECGNIGSPTSSPEIITSQFQNGNLHTFNIYDVNLNLLSSDAVSLEAVTSATKTMPIVGDINKDGINEYCMRTSSYTIMCYTASHTMILNVSYIDGQFNGIMSMGQYADGNTYQELISSTGIYKINASNTAELIYNFSGTQGMVLPVAIESKATFKKDLLYVQGLQFDYYISSGIPAVCGNDICEYSENPFTCPADCLNTNNSAEYGTVANGNLCNNDTWCISGICNIDTKTCQGLGVGVVCSLDAQCNSGNCDNNNLCTQQYVTDSVTGFLKLLGLGNIAGLMLVGLVIIFACLMIGARWAGFAGGFFGGAIGVLLSVLVFSLISLWFLFFFFMILIAIGVLIFIFGRGSE